MALTDREQARKAHLETLLTAIQDAEQGTWSAAVQEMSIGGRSLVRFKPEELAKYYRVYDQELKRLEAKEAGTRTRTVRVVG